MRRTRWWAAGIVLGALRLGAQEAADSGGRLFPLLDLGVARSLPATLASRSVQGLVGSDQMYESTRLRLDGQWGIIAEGRVPLGRAKVWGIEAYGARFRGRARASAASKVVAGAPPLAIVDDSIDYRVGGVTSWRGTLGVVRAVPLFGGLTGALLLGGTYGTVRSAGADCAPTATTSCTPKLDLKTPGFTVGADAFTRAYHGLRFRVSLKGDVLSVDEAEVRRSMRWSRFAGVPLGEGDRRWHVLPSGTIGVEFRIPL